MKASFIVIACVVGTAATFHIISRTYFCFFSHCLFALFSNYLLFFCLNQLLHCVFLPEMLCNLTLLTTKTFISFIFYSFLRIIWSKFLCFFYLFFKAFNSFVLVFLRFLRIVLLRIFLNSACAVSIALAISWLSSIGNLRYFKLNNTSQKKIFIKI